MSGPPPRSRAAASISAATAGTAITTGTTTSPATGTGTTRLLARRMKRPAAAGLFSPRRANTGVLLRSEADSDHHDADCRDPAAGGAHRDCSPEALLNEGTGGGGRQRNSHVARGRDAGNEQREVAARRQRQAVAIAMGQAEQRAQAEKRGGR